jgi:15-cis-phytoene synthase
MLWVRWASASAKSLAAIDSARRTGPCSPMNQAALIQALPPPSRLALAYAPRSVRAPVLALLALDARLASMIRSANEPVLAQIKLAWWRDRLGSRPTDWPLGEPLLAALVGWDRYLPALVALVDGWEALLLDQGPSALIDARVGAWQALAQIVGVSEAADSLEAAARCWAQSDLGVAFDRKTMPPIPRKLRSLAVLRGLAARQGQSPLRLILAAARTGLFGR